MHWVRLLVFCFFLVPAVYLPAQTILQFNQESGLPDDIVHNAIQDRSGNLWFATEYGLVKYDGIKYRTLGTGSGKELYTCVYEGPGNIIIGGLRGGIVVYFHDRPLVRIRLKLLTYCRKIVAAGSALYLLDTHGRLAEVSLRRGRLVLGRSMENVRDICLNGDGGICYLRGQNEIRQLSPDTEDTLLFCSRHPEWSALSYYRESVHVASGAALFRLERNELKPEVCLPFRDEIRQFSEDKYGQLWFRGGRNEPVLYSLKNGRLQEWSPRLGNNNTYNSLWISPDGFVLAGTYGKGVYLIANNEVWNYTETSYKYQLYINDILVRNSGYILFSSFNKLYRIYGGNIEPHPLNRYTADASYLHNMAFGEGRLYISSNFTREKTQYRQQRDPVDGSPVYFLKSRHVGRLNDADSTFWSDSFRADVSRVEKYGSAMPEKLCWKWGPQYKRISVYDMTLSGSDTLLATDNGIIVRGRSPVYRILNNVSINRLLPLKDLVLAGTSEGLYVIGHQGGRFEYRQYLPSYVIFDLLQDLSGRLWIASNKGLLCLNEQTLYTFNTANGLMSPHVKAIDLDRENNVLWIGTARGVSSLNISDLHWDDYLGNVDILHLKIEYYNRSHLFLGKGAEMLMIRPGERSVKTTIIPEHKYRDYPDIHYRVEIAGQAAFFLGSGEFLSVDRLPAGMYNCSVSASLNGYNWGRPLGFQIHIRTYPWEKGYFYPLIFSAALLLVIGAAALRIKYLQRKSLRQVALKKQMDELQMNALNSAINSHFLYNVLNAIQYFVNSNQNRKAVKFIAVFGKLVRAAVDRYDVNEISLEEELDRIRNYLLLEDMRLGGELGIDITVEVSPDPSCIMVPNMLLQPLAENAVMHGIVPLGAGNVRIAVKDEGAVLLFEVSDDGTGIRKKTPDGLAGNRKVGTVIFKERLSLFSGNLDTGLQYSFLDPEKKRGTLVRFRIPKKTMKKTGEE